MSCQLLEYGAKLKAHRHCCCCEKTICMAQISACMHQVPCSAAADATASRLRWAAVVAEMRSRSPTAAARAVRCSASQRHDFSLRPALHMHQVCASAAVNKERRRLLALVHRRSELRRPSVPGHQGSPKYGMCSGRPAVGACAAAADSSRAEPRGAQQGARRGEAFSDPAAVQQSLQPLNYHAQLASGSAACIPWLVHVATAQQPRADLHQADAVCLVP